MGHGPRLFVSTRALSPIGGQFSKMTHELQDLIISKEYALLSTLTPSFSEIANKGFKTVTSVNHPIAKIVFFDNSKDIGVFTEIMGITEEGEKAVKPMKSGIQ